MKTVRQIEAMIAARERANILQCQEIAKELGFDTMTFDLCGPKGKKHCKWSDAHLGFFTMEEVEGFCTVSDFKFASDIWCENMHYDVNKL